MAPLLGDQSPADSGVSSSSKYTPRFLIIGAGSRGNSYARAVTDSGLGVIWGVAEPIAFKRRQLCHKYIPEALHGLKNSESAGEPQSKGPAVSYGPLGEFESWEGFVESEHARRRNVSNDGNNPKGVDGVFVCVKDNLHARVVTALAPLGLHIMCEKPLATTLSDCLDIQRTLASYPPRVFAIGHVLRYSPHNMLLRDLLLEQKAIGAVVSMEHTEPVGWWHFSHSYVRGQWRKESTSAPSLLTKSCHDIDFILWMLCSPDEGGSAEEQKEHLPSRISSVGSLKQFRPSQKPKAARNATNCLSCPIKGNCMYSASRIYYDRHLANGNARWPVDIVNPEVEHILDTQGPESAKAALFSSLAEDYDTTSTPVADIESRPWFGRCVWECDNDVCDDQVVTFEWEAETDSSAEGRRGAKTATFHMIAHSLAQCERRGWIYGATGEISYDSKSITVHDFINDETRTYNPEVPKSSHHGGGDDGLTQQFLKAVIAVDSGGMSVPRAQSQFMGCTLEDTVRSHAAVFAAEEARRERKVVDWEEWWRENVAKELVIPP